MTVRGIWPVGNSVQWYESLPGQLTFVRLFVEGG